MRHLTVSDICAVEYCEKKAFLDSRLGKRVTPEAEVAIQAGLAAHKKLEREDLAGASQGAPGLPKMAFGKTFYFVAIIIILILLGVAL